MKDHEFSWGNTSRNIFKLALRPEKYALKTPTPKATLQWGAKMWLCHASSSWPIFPPFQNVFIHLSLSWAHGTHFWEFGAPWYRFGVTLFSQEKGTRCAQWPLTRHTANVNLSKTPPTPPLSPPHFSAGGCYGTWHWVRPYKGFNSAF